MLKRWDIHEAPACREPQLPVAVVAAGFVDVVAARVVAVLVS